jgi:membrane-bound metal-dependent hydrolase YbcI (DUF457 family)
MGRDHSISGIMTGLAVMEILDFTGHHPTPAAYLTAPVIVAGAALLPDWDHPNAIAAHTFGPLSRGIAHILNWLGEVLFALTATPYDTPRRDGHRLITHTAWFAAIMWGATWLSCQWSDPWGRRVVLFLCVGLALRGLAGSWAKRNGWLVVTALAAALAWAGARFIAELDAVTLGWLIALGCFTHCLGDSCTLDGCPWLAPLKIRGQRWYRIGTPRWMRFRTGTEEIDGEDYLRGAMLYVALPVLVLLWAVVLSPFPALHLLAR